MTWDTIWNISKLFALVLGGAAVIRLWSNTARDKLMEILKKELELAREHVERSDQRVEHYRKEMHATRDECTEITTKAQAALEFARDKLKEVELENARLLSKTSLEPIMEGLTQFMQEHRKFTEEQTAINAKVLEALQKLLDHPVINGNGFPK